MLYDLLNITSQLHRLDGTRYDIYFFKIVSVKENNPLLFTFYCPKQIYPTRSTLSGFNWCLFSVFFFLNWLFRAVWKYFERNFYLEKRGGSMIKKLKVWSLVGVCLNGWLTLRNVYIIHFSIFHCQYLLYTHRICFIILSDSVNNELRIKSK